MRPIPNLSLLIFLYMTLQYLVVPIIFALSSTHQDLNLIIISMKGLLSFVFGALLATKIFFQENLEIKKEIIRGSFDTPHLYYFFSLILLIIGMLLKLKSCLFYLVCDDYFYRLGRPNILYLAACLTASYGILLDISHKTFMRFKKIILLIGLFIILNILVAISGVGRSLGAYYAISLLLMIYTFNFKVNRSKFLIFGLLFLTMTWLAISIIKNTLVDHLPFDEALSFRFVSEKIIYRISQAHILESIYKNWPNNLHMGIYGWTDFFTMPSLGVERNYLNGNDFGYAMQLIGDDDLITGVGPTFIGDLYIRGGEGQGIILGMFFIGIFLSGYQIYLQRLNPHLAMLIVINTYPFLLHGTEDFIFLTLSTFLIMNLFYLIFFIAIEKIYLYLRPKISID